MKIFSLIIIILLISKTMASSLPDCSSDKEWHNCFGTYTFADGEKYVGEFKDGEFHGQGTYTFTDGENYVGGFKDGKRHGQGTYTYADRSIDRGYYLNGQLVSLICLDMGLKKGSESYGECVLKLIDKIEE